MRRGSEGWLPRTLKYVGEHVRDVPAPLLMWALFSSAATVCLINSVCSHARSQLLSTKPIPLQAARKGEEEKREVKKEQEKGKRVEETKKGAESEENERDCKKEENEEEEEEEEGEEEEKKNKEDCDGEQPPGEPDNLRKRK